METFPSETKHRTHEPPEEIARKFLATQVPKFLDWKAVYQFVGDDMKTIDFRAPGVLQRYADYREIEPEYLAEVLKGTPEFIKDYTEKVQPPKGKELYAYFVHGQRDKTNFLDHIELLAPGDLEEQKRLRDAIVSYKPEEDHTIQVGRYLADLDVTATIQEPAAAAAAAAEEEEDEEAPVDISVDAAKPWDEREHWTNPVLKAFGIQAELPKSFSMRKLGTQLLAASCAPGVQLPPSELGRFQTTVPTPDFSSHTHENFPIHLIDYVPSENISALVKLPEVQAYARSLKDKLPKDGRELVKSYLIRAHPTLGEGKEVSEDVINLLIH
jgi:hypothetical protein